MDCVCVGTYLVETMSWNVLEVTWKVDLFVEFSNVTKYGHGPH
jgi:hypothetical protein